MVDSQQRLLARQIRQRLPRYYAHGRPRPLPRAGFSKILLAISQQRRSKGCKRIRLGLNLGLGGQQRLLARQIRQRLPRYKIRIPTTRQNWYSQ
jgi:hypothetical protein